MTCDNAFMTWWNGKYPDRGTATEYDVDNMRESFRAGFMLAAVRELEVDLKRLDRDGAA